MPRAEDRERLDHLGERLARGGALVDRDDADDERVARDARGGPHLVARLRPVDVGGDAVRDVERVEPARAAPGRSATSRSARRRSTAKKLEHRRRRGVVVDRHPGGGVQLGARSPGSSTKTSTRLSTSPPRRLPKWRSAWAWTTSLPQPAPLPGIDRQAGDVQRRVREAVEGADRRGRCAPRAAARTAPPAGRSPTATRERCCGAGASRARLELADEPPEVGGRGLERRPGCSIQCSAPTLRLTISSQPAAQASTTARPNGSIVVGRKTKRS